MEESNLSNFDGTNSDLIKFARTNALISSNNAQAIVALAENMEGLASRTKKLVNDVRHLKKTDMYMTVKALNNALKQKWTREKSKSISYELDRIRTVLGQDRIKVPDMMYGEVWAYSPSVILEWCDQNNFDRPSRYRDIYE